MSERASASELPAAWHWLTSAEAQAALAETAAMFAEGSNAAAVQRRLRATIADPDRVATLLTQHDLRRRAERKFGDRAKTMLFTPAGLEQATRYEVARERAARFTRSGITAVSDLGCGIGAESLAMTDVGLRVHAVERDPLTAAFAAWNLAHTPAKVSEADAQSFPIPRGAVFCDPARRSAGHRDTRRVAPSEYSPPLDWVFAQVDAHGGGVKLGPGHPHELIPAHLEAQWTSVDGSVVEVALYADNGHGSGRSAQVLRDGTAHVLRSPGSVATVTDADTTVAPRKLGEFLYDPDGAVIRARLLGELCGQLSGATPAGTVSDDIAYLTGDTGVVTPFAQCLKILEVLPLREKLLAKALRQRNIGSLEIKKRGVSVDPAALRTRLGLRGSGQAVLVLTRSLGKHVAILAARHKG